MKRITSREIRALKKIIKDQRDRINELEAQLEESRAKEGKGCLETAIESIGQLCSNICDAFSEMSPDELRALAEMNDDDLTIEEDDT